MGKQRLSASRVIEDTAAFLQERHQLQLSLELRAVIEALVVALGGTNASAGHRMPGLSDEALRSIERCHQLARHGEALGELFGQLSTAMAEVFRCIGGSPSERHAELQATVVSTTDDTPAPGGGHCAVFVALHPEVTYIDHLVDQVMQTLGYGHADELTQLEDAAGPED